MFYCIFCTFYISVHSLYILYHINVFSDFSRKAYSCSTDQKLTLKRTRLIKIRVDWCYFTYYPKALKLFLSRDQVRASKSKRLYEISNWYIRTPLFPLRSQIKCKMNREKIETSVYVGGKCTKFKTGKSAYVTAGFCSDIR